MMLVATLVSVVAVAAPGGGGPAPDPHPSAGPGPIAWWSYHVDSPLFDEHGKRVRGVKQRCYVPAHGKRRCVLVRR